MFPDYAGSLAMAPDRLVRLTFEIHTLSIQVITGAFKNLGIGPAFNLKHGLGSGLPGDHLDHLPTPALTAGLREGELLTRLGGPHFFYVIRNTVNGNAIKLYCQYENRFGDHYRVEIPFSIFSTVEQASEEELWIATGDHKTPIWTRVA
jgi:hypothetical protein